MQSNCTTSGNAVPENTISGNTTSGSTTPGNKDKLAQLKAGWADLLTQAMQRGFYGNVAIELAVQDGTIQHIRQRVERIDR